MLLRPTKGQLPFRVSRPYRSQQASSSYEGYAWFSLSPFVFRTRCFSGLRRFSFLPASHLRIAASKLHPLTKGMPCFHAQRMYIGSGGPDLCEGSASFSRLTSVSRPGSGFKNETHASRAEDDGLSSGPSAPRYPSSFTNHKINSTPETSKLVSGVSLFYASLILKTLTSFRPCRRRLRALPERVP